MRRIRSGLWLAALCSGLAIVTMPAQAVTIVAGSGANPPATATGIYEIARLEGQKVQKALALVHRGTLQEVHSRGTIGYQRREAGSTAIKISTAAYEKLLTLAGGPNRDVNTMPLVTRCEFYGLAGIPTAGMTCPVSRPPPAKVAPSGDSCPSGYQKRLEKIDGKAQWICVPVVQAPASRTVDELLVQALPARAPTSRTIAAWIERLLPIATAEARILMLQFKSDMFFRPISFGLFSPEASGTEYGGWSFQGFGFDIRWLNDGP